MTLPGKSSLQGDVEERLCLLPAYTREAFEEVVQGIPSAQVSDQRVHRHPGSGEHGGTSQHFGVLADNLIARHTGLQVLLALFRGKLFAAMAVRPQAGADWRASSGGGRTISISSS